MSPSPETGGRRTINCGLSTNRQLTVAKPESGSETREVKKKKGRCPWYLKVHADGLSIRHIRGGFSPKNSNPSSTALQIPPHPTPPQSTHALSSSRLEHVIWSIPSPFVTIPPGHPCQDYQTGARQSARRTSQKDGKEYTPLSSTLSS